MEFKNRAERAKCYEVRDAYFECVDKHPKDKAKENCGKAYGEFEKLCGAKWTEHFIRRRDYLKYKEKLEIEGFDAVDKDKFKS